MNRPRIMVVDDEEDILTIIKSGLEAKGSFRVEAFTSAEMAFNNFLNHPIDYYDIILTDIRMPKMSGFELYKKIKERDHTKRVAFITAFEINREELNKVIPSARTNEFISKPISIADLAKRLKLILSAHSDRHQEDSV